MFAAVPELDPRIIERFAESLYRKSTNVVVACVAGGVTLGAIFGAVPLTSVGDVWPVPRAFGLATMLVGGLAGGLVGYVVGDARSSMYRLHAQIALAQITAAKDAAEVLSLLRAPAREVESPPANATRSVPVQPPPPPPVTPTIVRSG